jgi:predicted nuclease of predicted toxin-antitoxin system
VRVLADENMPGEVVNALRERGHDIAWVRTEMPGSTDRIVLERAQSEKRLLLTFDKDFGELAFRFGLPVDSGVVLFRITMSSPADVAAKAAAVLESRDDWAAHFSVVQDDRVRMIPIPVRKR